MDFLKELQEARMTRDENNQKKLTYSDCCERLYLLLLGIECLRQYPGNKNFIVKYASNSKHFNYKHFKISGTDVYNLIYFINGNEQALEKLKDYESAKRMQADTGLPLNDIIDYLKRVGSNQTGILSQQLFIRLENGLHIQNTSYKDIRRSLPNIVKLPANQQKNVITKLLFAFRAKLRNSDLIEYFSTFIANFDLESRVTKDTEPEISKPDIGTSPKDVMYYRLISEPRNLILIKKFLELSKEGKACPANVMTAYAPVAGLINDIVSAGPTFIQMLKAIQKRAKKARTK